jgi:hypothetical protein
MYYFVASTSADSSLQTSDAVYRLVEMGFTESAATLALAENGDDLPTAAAFLVSQLQRSEVLQENSMQQSSEGIPVYSPTVSAISVTPSELDFETGSHYSEENTDPPPPPVKTNLFGNGRKFALGFLPRVKPRPPSHLG